MESEENEKQSFGEMESYEEMLEELYSKLPEKVKKKERFEMPRVNAFIEGNKTIFKNFLSIAQLIRRDVEMFAKYLSRELASPVKIDGNRLIIQRRVNLQLLQRKVELFIKDYVLCWECGKPDTKIAVIEGVKMLICEACGARRPIR